MYTDYVIAARLRTKTTNVIIYQLDGNLHAVGKNNMKIM
jgi:hypothetical protein